MRPAERHVNLALAWLGLTAFVTGWLAFGAGTPFPGAWVAAAHGMLGMGLLVVAPWKQAIARRGLRRTRPGRGTSLALSVVAVITVVSGAALTTGTLDRLGPFTTMQIHVGAAVLTLGLGVAHLRRRPVHPVDHDRRRFLRAVGTAVGAATLWGMWEATLGVIGLPGSDRRFTGSHPRGSHHPAAMPVTQWLDDRVPVIDAASWRLDLAGEVVDLAWLEQRELEEITATIDCTGGWYATQCWHGVRLDRLLPDAGAQSVVVWSHTGYARRFPTSELDRLWVAVGYEGERLRPGHGYPVRLVAPGRRGFWWVKWVVKVEPSPLPWWVQSPFPLT